MMFAEELTCISIFCMTDLTYSLEVTPYTPHGSALLHVNTLGIFNMFKKTKLTTASEERVTHTDGQSFDSRLVNGFFIHLSSVFL